MSVPNLKPVIPVRKHNFVINPTTESDNSELARAYIKKIQTFINERIYLRSTHQGTTFPGADYLRGNYAFVGETSLLLLGLTNYVASIDMCFYHFPEAWYIQEDVIQLQLENGFKTWTEEFNKTMKLKCAPIHALNITWNNIELYKELARPVKMAYIYDFTHPKFPIYTLKALGPNEPSVGIPDPCFLLNQFWEPDVNTIGEGKGRIIRGLIYFVANSSEFQKESKYISAKGYPPSSDDLVQGLDQTWLNNFQRRFSSTRTNRQFGKQIQLERSVLHAYLRFYPFEKVYPNQQPDPIQ
ncbi:hypothetical protein B0J11DRAFT_608291 [Dendryphion nanum]|uniref:Uncharacterized protein n=1 Tax=Dendryphion nanum TaxID=256645 RepID=A0A9P9DP70_9PLEO|nr:hypothetical protein B0J11DRAFT_608291 [Dendryphion nanum]